MGPAHSLGAMGAGASMEGRDRGERPTSANGVTLRRTERGDIAALHPMLTAQLPLKQGIADSLEFRDVPCRIETKYGDGAVDVRRLVDEVSSRFLPAAAPRVAKPLWRTGAA